MRSITSATPKQVHIAFTGKKSEMQVTWSHEGVDACSGSALSVKYGPTTSLGSTAEAKSDYLSSASLCTYTATMTGLTGQNAEYHYNVGGSTTYSFTHNPIRKGGKIYAAFADFGLANDISLDRMLTEASQGQWDAVLHAGDLAYDLDLSEGRIGNEFMATIEPMSSKFPWMTCPGNHEAQPDHSFANYLHRFAGLKEPAKNSGSTDLRWYSVDDNVDQTGVHIVSLDSELFSYGGTPTEIKEQLEWLKDDMAKVDRTVTPWIVVIMHKAQWMDKQHVAPLIDALEAGGANLMIVGHSHLYDREKVAGCMPDENSYVDCKKLPIMVVGSPGCKEKTSTGFGPSPAAKSSAYGFGHLHVVNATHIEWKWEETGAASASSKKTAVRGLAPAGASFSDHATFIRTKTEAEEAF